MRHDAEVCERVKNQKCFERRKAFGTCPPKGSTPPHASAPFWERNSLGRGGGKHGRFEECERRQTNKLKSMRGPSLAQPRAGEWPQSHLEFGAVVSSEAPQLFPLSTMGTAPENLFPGNIGAHGRH